MSIELRRIHDEAATSAQLKEAVRSAPLTRTEREITAVLLRMWMRRGERSHINPGREWISTKVRCATCTVAEALKKLRSLGVLEVVGCASGGKDNTRYVFNTRALLLISGLKSRDEAAEGQRASIYYEEQRQKELAEKVGRSRRLTPNSIERSFRFSPRGDLEVVPLEGEINGGQEYVIDGPVHVGRIAPEDCIITGAQISADIIDEGRWTFEDAKIAVKQNTLRAPLMSFWRHQKSGKIYYVRLHVILEGNLEPHVIYAAKAGEEGATWCRPAREFFDGRFLRID